MKGNMFGEIEIFDGIFFENIIKILGSFRYTRYLQ
jgi:hypothetical protein